MKICCLGLRAGDVEKQVENETETGWFTEKEGLRSIIWLLVRRAYFLIDSKGIKKRTAIETNTLLSSLGLSA